MSSLKEIIAMDMFVAIPSGGGKCFDEKFLRSMQIFTVDVRLRDWPLMSSIWPTVIIVICYVLFIIFGQQWMKKRQAFELRDFMFVYNLIQVVLCAYITYEVRKSIEEQSRNSKTLFLGNVCMDQRTIQFNLSTSRLFF